MRSIFAALLLASATTLFAGCATETQPDEATTDQTEDELTTNQIVGTWEAVSGPIYRIEFTNEKTSTLGGWAGRAMHATVDNGVRCITTPCPSSDEVSAVYRISFGTRITFEPYDRPGLTLAKYTGEYKIALSKDTLKLTKTDGTVVSTLRKAKGVKCGTAICGAGLTCCNPLQGICVKPGMMCTQ